MKVAIVGGGIAGLTTALALQKVGIDFEVFERAPALNEIGAGIWMQPNAMKVLNWLDLGDEIINKGAQLKRAEVTNNQLQPYTATDEEVQDEQGNSITAIHRARLQQTLYDHLPNDKVHLNNTYQSHSEENNKVTIQFDQGSFTADLLIGADGIHSGVRQQLFPSASTRYSGQTCWRGIAPIQLPAAHLGIGREAWGKNVRFGLSNISHDEVYWFAVAKAPQHGKDNPSTLKMDLLALFRNFHPVVLELIDHTPIDKITRNDISDLKRLDQWYQGRTCLAGDAAHATTPNMGQGACQGMEDGYYLGQLLAKHQGHETAFQQFDKLRRKKVDYVVNNSWRFGQMAHHTLGQFLMKTIMKVTPAKVIQQQMKQLYSVDQDF